jgi:hypothetical protein
LLLDSLHFMTDLHLLLTTATIQCTTFARMEATGGRIGCGCGMVRGSDAFAARSCSFSDSPQEETSRAGPSRLVVRSIWQPSEQGRALRHGKGVVGGRHDRQHGSQLEEVWRHRSNCRRGKGGSWTVGYVRQADRMRNTNQLRAASVRLGPLELAEVDRIGCWDSRLGCGDGRGYG